MGLRYKIDVLQSLKMAGYNTTRLRRERLLSEGTIQRIRSGEVVGTDNLSRICAMLQCQPGEVLEYVSDEKADDNQPETAPTMETPYKERVNTAFDAMNPTGQKETARTVEVLAASPIYRRKREPSEEGQKEKPPEGT
ncbi:MAG: helix-turn-helix transcriptional regulator [Clostridiales bacterium]|nr:helix-turn-helix transcriptional regulator [Clostridiales bacterium]